MAQISPNNPLPPCPVSPNCIRTSQVFEAGTGKISEVFEQIFRTEAYKYEVVNPTRIELHAVYQIPVFGFKDDVDVIIEETSNEDTIVFIRSASRLGAYDLGVNNRRVNRILRKIQAKINVSSR